MSKRSIPNLPPLTANEMFSDDLLVAVNDNRTKKIFLSELFAAGYVHSVDNKFTSDTQIGADTTTNNLSLAVTVGAGTNRKIVFGGDPSLVSGENLVTSFGDIFVSEPYVFRTTTGDSNRWDEAAAHMGKLYGTSSSFLFTLDDGAIIPAKLISSPSIVPKVVYNSETDVNELSLSVSANVEIEGNLTTHHYYVTNDGNDRGLTLSSNNTLAIHPSNANRTTWGIGTREDETGEDPKYYTHIANNALTVWGNIYVDGTITASDIEGTLNNFGIENMAFQSANNVFIAGGTISGATINTPNFTSRGIDDNAVSTTITLSTANFVGVGTSTPSQKLHVEGTVRSNGIQVANTAGVGIQGSATIAGSYIDIKQAGSDIYGLRFLSNTEKNSIQYSTFVPLRIYSGDTERLSLGTNGRMNLGLTQSTPPMIFNIRGNETLTGSSMTLQNIKTSGEAWTNIYFGNNTNALAHWIKFQHLNASLSAVKTMSFGIDDKSRIDITPYGLIQFNDAAGSTRMVWDGTNAELRIEGNKVWHAGNDGTGSGSDADLLDGQHGSWHRTWYNLINKPTLQLIGDVTGSASFHIEEAETVVSINASVTDYSHLHYANNVVNLDDRIIELSAACAFQTIADQSHAAGIGGGHTIDGSGIYADMCDGQHLGITSSPTFANLTVTGTINESSDERLKENIDPLTNALEVINKLNGVSFNKIETPDKREHGFIAQEVESIVPEIVETDDEGYKSINYSRLTALLVEAIKELSKKIDNR